MLKCSFVVSLWDGDSLALRAVGGVYLNALVINTNSIIWPGFGLKLA